MCPWDRGLALGWLRGLGVPVPMVQAHRFGQQQQDRAQDKGCHGPGMAARCVPHSFHGMGQLPGLRGVFIFQAERKLVIPKPSVFSQTSHSLAEETHVSRSPLSPLSYCFESERIGCRFQGMFRQRLFEQHLCK